MIRCYRCDQRRADLHVGETCCVDCWVCAGTGQFDLGFCGACQGLGWE